MRWVGKRDVNIPDVSAIWPKEGFPLANLTFVVEVAVSEGLDNVDAKARRYLSDYTKVQQVLVAKAWGGTMSMVASVGQSKTQ